MTPDDKEIAFQKHIRNALGSEMVETGPVPRGVQPRVEYLARVFPGAMEAQRETDRLRAENDELTRKLDKLDKPPYWLLAIGLIPWLLLLLFYLMS